MEIVTIAVLAVLGVVFVTSFASKLGVASPLLLVASGVLVSVIPGFPEVDIDPEIILLGVLPPLLYSAAVQMPTMDFRRDLRAITGLSAALVMISALLIGWFVSMVVPGISLAIGIALGAIVAPTDAVATTIVQRLGVTPRLVTILQGESLLNDATALVLLRSALAASAVGVSLAEVAWDFLVAVVVAVAIGSLVGWLTVWARSFVISAPLSSAVSFTVPFLAYIPVEHLGGSGLVAAVAAGLVSGYFAPRRLSPTLRLAEEQNWLSIEFLLEGGVFLLMGLELLAIVNDVREEQGSLWLAIGVAVAVATLVNLIRAAYVAPMLWFLRRRRIQGEEIKERIAQIQARIDEGIAPRPKPGVDQAVLEARVDEQVEQFQTRARRVRADIAYHTSTPMGWREGIVLVWAGMRGVVTLAAAQTLPADTPERSLLVLIAVIVAVGTLIVQGITLPWVVRRVDLSAEVSSVFDPDRVPLLIDLGRAAEEFLTDPELVRADGSAYSEETLQHLREHLVLPTDDEERGMARVAQIEYRELRAKVVRRMREALLDLRRDGLYSSQALINALRILDADQITTEMRVARDGGRPGGGQD